MRFSRSNGDDCGGVPVRRACGHGPVFTVVALVAVFAAGSAGAAAQGDANLDGEANVGDALLIHRHVTGEAPLTDGPFLAADIAPLSNGASQPDGLVDAADLMVFLQLHHLPVPTLQIEDPLPSPMTNPILASGTATAGATVTLFVNGVAQDSIEAVDGSFDLPVFLFDGDNSVRAVETTGGIMGLGSPDETVNYVNNVDPDAPIDGLVAWTAAGPDGSGFYDIDGGLEVLDGGELVLLDNVELRFGNYRTLTVQDGGVLRVLGHAGNEVLLTRQSDFWWGIVIEGGGTATFQYTEIENVGVSLAESPSIEVKEGGDLVLADSVVRFFAGNGIVIRKAAKADVRRTEIRDSLASGDPQTAIFIEGPSDPMFPVVIADNTIRNLNSRGIWIDEGATPLIDGNEIGGGLNIGIETTGSTPVVVGNNIHDINGPGIRIHSGSPDIQQNSITKCRNAIDMTGGSPVISWNTLGHLTAQFKTFQLQGSVVPGQIIDAQNNTWLTTEETIETNPGEIVKLLGDFSTSTPPTLATVDFVPFLDQDGNPTGANILYGEVLEDVTLDAGTYLLVHSYVVAEGVTLTISPGVTIEALTTDPQVGASLVCHGTLLLGSSGDPVILRSAEAQPQAGDWLGIQLTPTSTGNVIDNAVIEHAEIGIDVSGTEVIVTGSTLRDLSTGIQVGQDGEVTISQSNLYDNDTNILALDLVPTGDDLVLVAHNNWWGETVADDIRSTMDDGHGAVDFSFFLDGIDGTVIGSSSEFTMVIVDVTRDKETIVPTQMGGDPLPIHFRVLAVSDVELRIYEHQSDEFGGSTLVGTKSVGTSLLGVIDVDWDGKGGANLDGALVTDGAYYYEIYADMLTGPAYLYSPVAPYQQTPSFLTTEPTGAIVADYNVYKNQALKFSYTLTTLEGRQDWVNRARIHAQVTPGPTSYVIDHPPSYAGSYNVSWDGRDATGALVPSPESSFTQIWVLATEALNENAFLVVGGVPIITGPVEAQVQSDPYLVHHSYEQVSQIEYCIDRESDVTIQILQPGVFNLVPSGGYADGVVETFTQLAAPEGCYTVTWHGYDPGQINFDDALPDSGSGTGGVYTFAIEAANSANPTMKRLHRGVIQVRK